jgi:hypothetical protein
MSALGRKRSLAVGELLAQIPRLLRLVGHEQFQEPMRSGFVRGPFHGAQRSVAESVVSHP